ncbi:hypothetical protein HY991_02205 [Candidatus Micrarchaeota archaeon]|nr:hypothetical protein [Candidatus Micrarchaeota archaeon]
MEEEYGFEEGFLDKVKNAFSDLALWIRRFGVIKFSILVIILLSLVWYFFLYPKPATLTVALVEKDSGKALDGTVEILEDGETARNCFLFFMCNNIESKMTEKGIAEFLVPSEKDLTIVADVGSNYAGIPRTISLASGESKSETIEVPRNWDLAIENAPSIDVTVGAGCTKMLTVTVKNKGDASASVEFVGTGELERLIKTQPSPLGPKGESNFQVPVVALGSKGKVKGELRIKYTEVSIPVSLTTTDKPQLSVISPEGGNIDCRNPPCTNLVRIKNLGESEITELSVKVSDNLAELVKLISFDANSIPPGEELNFWVQIAPVTESTFGKLIVSHACPPKRELTVSISGPTAS